MIVVDDGVCIDKKGSRWMFTASRLQLLNEQLLVSFYLVRLRRPKSLG